MGSQCSGASHISLQGDCGVFVEENFLDFLTVCAQESSQPVDNSCRGSVRPHKRRPSDPFVGRGCNQCGEQTSAVVASWLWSQSRRSG